jgi:hypothetical protein
MCCANIVNVLLNRTVLLRCCVAGMLLLSNLGLMRGWTRCSCCSCRVMGGWHLSMPSVGTRPSCQGPQVGGGRRWVGGGANILVLSSWWEGTSRLV